MKKHKINQHKKEQVTKIKQGFSDLEDNMEDAEKVLKGRGDYIKDEDDINPFEEDQDFSDFDDETKS